MRMCALVGRGEDSVVDRGGWEGGLTGHVNRVC